MPNEIHLVRVCERVCHVITAYDGRQRDENTAVTITGTGLAVQSVNDEKHVVDDGGGSGGGGAHDGVQ